MMGRGRRRKASPADNALGLLVLAFVFGLTTGQVWAWGVLILILVIAALVGAAEQRTRSQPQHRRHAAPPAQQASRHVNIPPTRLLAPGQRNPWGVLNEMCEQGTSEQIVAAIHNLQPYFDEARPGLSAPDWRKVGEGFERNGDKLAAAEAYRKALAINQKVGVKRRLAELEKELGGEPS